MRLFKHPIYPITRDSENGHNLVSQIECFVSSGCSLIQLRSKLLNSRELFEVAIAAKKHTVGTDTKLIINDRADLALAADLDGVHLGQTDLDPFHARRLLGETKLIGFSTHNALQLSDALLKPVDYVALGPVFPTKTKENPDPVVGIENLSDLIQTCRKTPLVTIGGISSSNISSVAASGAAAAAVIGAVAGDCPETQDAIKELNGVWNEFR